MSYDSWKLDSGDDPRAARLADLCSDVEWSVERALERAMDAANAGSTAKWETQEVLAEADDGEPTVEFTVRLRNLPVSSRREVRDLAAAFQGLSDTLQRLAAGDANASLPTGPKMAPSVHSRGATPQSEQG